MPHINKFINTLYLYEHLPRNNKSNLFQVEIHYSAHLASCHQILYALKKNMIGYIQNLYYIAFICIFILYLASIKLTFQLYVQLTLKNTALDVKQKI